MSGWLIDTNVISELRRPRPAAKVVRFIASRKLAGLHLSVVTLAEIRFGIELQSEAAIRASLKDWLEHRIRPQFAGRTLAITEDVMLRWRFLVAEGRKAGHTYSQPDLIIAATAHEYDLTVVTRDTSEYRRAGCRVVDPWNDDLSDLPP